MRSAARPYLPTLLSALAVVMAGAVPAHAGVGFVFTADGVQATPPALDSEASASCVGVLDDDETEFTINCTHDVEGVVAAHIHRAPRGVPGPIIFALEDPTSPIQALWELDERDVADLLAGNLYVNIHSMDHPAGEIRGQIRLDPSVAGSTMQFEVSAQQTTPPIDSEARGRCLAVLDDAETTLEVTCVHDVDNPVAAHIHEAPRGVNGPIVYPFDDPSSPIRQSADLTEAQNATLLPALRAGELYVNVHSMEHPAGEARGQMDYCKSSATSLCLTDDRFRVEASWETRQGTSGVAHAVPQQADTGMFWFFEPDNLELLVKVLDTCAVNGNRWVFLAGTTNVGFEVTVTDTWTDETRSYTNPISTTAEAVTDVTAFPCT